MNKVWQHSEKEIIHNILYFTQKTISDCHWCQLELKIPDYGPFYSFQFLTKEAAFSKEYKTI